MFEIIIALMNFKLVERAMLASDVLPKPAVVAKHPANKLLVWGRLIGEVKAENLKIMNKVFG